MKGNAALLWEQPGRWDVGEVDLDPPQRGEVLVRLVATGLCHSDDHFATNDIPLPHLPVCAGHEGAGVVVEVGTDVHALRPGDHIALVLFTFRGPTYGLFQGLGTIPILLDFDPREMANSSASVSVRMRGRSSTGGTA